MVWSDRMNITQWQYRCSLSTKAARLACTVGYMTNMLLLVSDNHRLQLSVPHCICSVCIHEIELKQKSISINLAYIVMQHAFAVSASMN